MKMINRPAKGLASKPRMLNVDGSSGEGGGQILRTSLALSMCLGKPFHIFNIRSVRKNPGLQYQHLAAVNAAAKITRASVEGAKKGSMEVTFVPQRVVAGEYHFSIGTAGSTTLLLQTLLPPLLTADGPSTLILEGGTHNPHAPPFEFLEQVFLPLINRMGPTVTIRLERAGYYPRGGGVIRIHIQPSKHLEPFQLLTRGEILETQAIATVANLPVQIAERELGVIGHNLGLQAEQLHLRKDNTAFGPGNVVLMIIKSRHITEVFTAFGERHVRAETVADKVVTQVRRYLAAGVPVGNNLADQLLLPLALSGAGAYSTLEPSLHTTTNIAVIKTFMAIQIMCEEIQADIWRVSLGPR